jgi:integrase
LFRFILNTGLRRSEALGLRWADVGDDLLTITGKGGKTRLTPLNAEARAIVGQRSRVGPFVFNVPNRASPSLLRSLTATISRDAGVPFHLHLLRHYFATQLLRNGIDIVTISGILGHSATMTTLLYTHSSAGQMRQAVDTLRGHLHMDVSG